MHFSFIYFLFKKLSNYQVQTPASNTQQAMTIQVKIHTKSVVRVYSRLTHIHTSKSTSESENFLWSLKTAIAIVKSISLKKWFFNVYSAFTEGKHQRNFSLPSSTSFSVNGPYR